MAETTGEDDDDKVPGLADELSEKLDADVLLFNADIERSAAVELETQIRNRKRRKNVCVLMVTLGGDPDAAFIIGRLLQAKYERVIGYVAGFCKSSGTLAMLGAHELVVGDLGELGPLDIQVAKSDDLGNMNSGLMATTALDELRAESFQMFEKTFLEIKRRSSGQISFRMASEIAANLTVGLFSPIFSQIQAMHIGEVGRANLITRQYGQRLATGSKNLKANALGMLAYAYPSHEFVIDRREAKRLFVNVRPPSDLEQRLFDELGDCAVRPLHTVTTEGHSHDEIIDFLSNEHKELELESEQVRDETTGGDAEHRGDSPNQADERRSVSVSAGDAGNSGDPSKGSARLGNGNGATSGSLL